MNNLLKVDFKRLLCNLTILIVIIVSIVYGLNVGRTIRVNYMSFYEIADSYSSFVFILSIFLIIFYSIFINKDYNYKTIRNKLVAGNSRINIYMSKLLVGLLLFFIIYGIYIITSYISISVNGVLTDRIIDGFIKTGVIVIGTSIYNVGLIMMCCNYIKNEYGIMVPMVIYIGEFFLYVLAVSSDNLLLDIFRYIIPFEYISGSFDISLSNTLYGSALLAIEGLIFLLIGYLLYRKSDIN